MLLLQLFTLIKIWKVFFCFYLFWFCHLFKPCYAYIVQVQQIAVRVISLTQFHYEVNPISAQNGTWPADLRFARPHVVRFIFETKIWILYANWLTEGNLDHQVLWTISLVVNQYMNTAIKSTGGLAAEQSLVRGLAIEPGANDNMSHLLQL